MSTLTRLLPPALRAQEPFLGRAREEVGMSGREPLSKSTLPTGGFLGQVYVVMSALSDLREAVDMFNESKRKSFKSCLCEELTRQVVLTLDRQQKQHRSASAWLESHCLLCPRRVPDSAPAKLKPPFRWFWRQLRKLEKWGGGPGVGNGLPQETAFCRKRPAVGNSLYQETAETILRHLFRKS